MKNMSTLLSVNEKVIIISFILSMSINAFSREWEFVGTVDDLQKWEDTNKVENFGFVSEEDILKEYKTYDTIKETKEEVIARWKRESIELDKAIILLKELEEYLGRKPAVKDKLIERLGKWRIAL